MKTLKHTTAKASYYNTRAECYDEFNENNSKAINALLEKILKEQMKCLKILVKVKFKP